MYIMPSYRHCEKQVKAHCPDLPVSARLPAAGVGCAGATQTFWHVCVAT